MSQGQLDADAWDQIRERHRLEARIRELEADLEGQIIARHALRSTVQRLEEALEAEVKRLTYQLGVYKRTYGRKLEEVERLREALDGMKHRACECGHEARKALEQATSQPPPDPS